MTGSLPAVATIPSAHLKPETPALFDRRREAYEEGIRCRLDPLVIPDDPIRKLYAQLSELALEADETLYSPAKSSEVENVESGPGEQSDLPD